MGNMSNTQIIYVEEGASAKSNQVTLRWLGQAGFDVCYKNIRLMIDPYLSNYLAKKYRDREFKHVRMMPSQLDAEEIENVDWVLCTHRHSDYMAPGSLPVILNNNKNCRLLVPRAEKIYTTDFERFAKVNISIKIISR